MSTAAILDCEAIFARRQQTTAAARQADRAARLRRIAAEFANSLQALGEPRGAIRRAGAVLHCEALFTADSEASARTAAQSSPEYWERAARLKALAREYAASLQSLPVREAN